MFGAETGLAVPRALFGCSMCGEVLVAKRWGGAECGYCRSVSTHILPTREEIARFYQSYSEVYSGGGSSGGQNLKRYADRYLQIVRQHVGARKLIDVGSSTNPFPNVAAGAGFDVTVMDYVRPSGLSPSIRFLQGSINDAQLPPQLEGGFDVVTAWAVIEHLPAPKFSARVLSRICRRGGKLFLSTPEIGTFLTNHSIGRSPWFYPPEHLCLQSPRAIAQAFDVQGCTLLKWGRLELTPLRYVARYGIGVAEALVGLPVKLFLPTAWQTLRDSRLHLFKGITYFVLERR